MLVCWYAAKHLFANGSKAPDEYYNCTATMPLCLYTAMSLRRYALWVCLSATMPNAALAVLISYPT